MMRLALDANKNHDSSNVDDLGIIPVDHQYVELSEPLAEMPSRCSMASG
jgi:hypothetical protein